MTDSNGLFLEENLDIRVVDEFRPIVRTMEGVAGDPVFDPRLVIENYTHAGMGPRIPEGTPLARFNAVSEDGEPVGNSFQFEMLSDGEPILVEPPLQPDTDWLSVQARVEDLTIQSSREYSEFSLILDNLTVDPSLAPAWLAKSDGTAWFVLVRRTYDGRIEDLFSTFDSRYMFGYATPVFLDGKKVTPCPPFIAFPGPT